MFMFDAKGILLIFQTYGVKFFYLILFCSHLPFNYNLSSLLAQFLVRDEPTRRKYQEKIKKTRNLITSTVRPFIINLCCVGIFIHERKRLRS